MKRMEMESDKRIEKLKRQAAALTISLTHVETMRLQKEQEWEKR